MWVLAMQVKSSLYSVQNSDFELVIEGSSATDSVTDVTDVTDVRKKEIGIWAGTGAPPLQNPIISFPVALSVILQTVNS